MRSMTIVPGVALAALAMSVAVSPAGASDLTANQQTIDSAILTSVLPASDAPRGVSPEAFFDEATGTYYLLTTSMPPVQYSSKDGVTWEPTSTALPQGIDWSIVQEGVGSYRLYYAEIVPTAPGTGPSKPCTPKTKVLKYATSSDLQTWTPQPGVLLDDVGCGVPHVMKTRAGKYFLYLNKADPIHGVYIAQSADGLTWSTPQGPINGDTELVDPAPVELPDGTFLMVASTTGGKGQFQHLQLLASADAIQWSKRSSALYAPTGAGAFDPSVELVDGTLHVWFGYSPQGSYEAAQITHGTLELGAAEEAQESIQLSCSRGKSKGKPVVKCSGTVMGIAEGTSLQGSMRPTPRSPWKKIARKPKVDSEGAFQWTFTAPKSSRVWVRVSHLSTVSNAVVVRIR